MRSVFLILCACLVLGACGGGKAPEEHGLRRIVLPDGTVIRAETMLHAIDMTKGMMFRESLPDGRGMLFVHPEPGNYPYWMFQVKIPLDLVWMDTSGRVTEIVENAPPCNRTASDCPTYGGNARSHFVLEITVG